MTQVDWLSMPVRFWIASFDCKDAKSFLALLRRTDQAKYTMVKAHFREFVQMRRLIRDRSSAILREPGGAHDKSGHGRRRPAGAP